MNHHVIDLGFVQVCAMAGMDTVQQLPRSGRGQKMEGEQRIILLHGHEKARGLIQNRAGWAHHAGVGVARGKTR